MRKFAMTADSMARLAAAGDGRSLIRLAKSGHREFFRSSIRPTALANFSCVIRRLVATKIAPEENSALIYNYTAIFTLGLQAAAGVKIIRPASPALR
jgi:hypothetical protein